MMDTIISTFSSNAHHTPTIHYGKIVECTERRAGKKNQFAITDLVIHNASGYRMFSVSLPTGLYLHECISHDNRRNRMKDTTFEFKVVNEIQRIIGFTMHDAAEWIGDTIDREEN